MVSSVGLNVLALLTKPDTVVDRAVKDRQVSRQVLQQPRLLVGVLNLDELLHLLSRDFERPWHHSDGREDGLVVRPDEEREKDVEEHQQKEGLDSTVNNVDAQLDYVGIPAPAILGGIRRKTTNDSQLQPTNT